MLIRYAGGVTGADSVTGALLVFRITSTHMIQVIYLSIDQFPIHLVFWFTILSF